MDNYLIVIDALGEHIKNIENCNMDHRAEIEYLQHEVKEYQKIVVNLEKELEEEKKKPPVTVYRDNPAFICPCDGCKYFKRGHIDPAVFAVCQKWDIWFRAIKGTIDPRTFSCPFAKKIEAGTE